MRQTHEPRSDGQLLIQENHIVTGQARRTLHSFLILSQRNRNAFRTFKTVLNRGEGCLNNRFLPGIQVSLLADCLRHGLGLLVLLSALHHFFDGLLQLSLNSHQLIHALGTVT